MNISHCVQLCAIKAGFIKFNFVGRSTTLSKIQQTIQVKSSDKPAFAINIIL